MYSIKLGYFEMFLGLQAFYEKALKQKKDVIVTIY